MTAHARPQGWTEQPMSYITAFQELDAWPKNLTGGRIEILLRTGKRYWIRSITEEWGDVIRVITEPSGLPVYIRKLAILTMHTDPGRTGAGPQSG